jgi:hypothetical protein
MCSYIAHGDWCYFRYCHCQTWGGHLPFLLYLRWWGYKQGNRVGYNMISIRIISLLTYFTCTFIDIIIYTLRSMSWSYRIFEMVARVLADLGYRSLSLVRCKLIRIAMSQMSDSCLLLSFHSNSTSIMFNLAYEDDIDYFVGQQVA